MQSYGVVASRGIGIKISFSLLNEGKINLCLHDQRHNSIKIEHLILQEKEGTLGWSGVLEQAVGSGI